MTFPDIPTEVDHLPRWARPIAFVGIAILYLTVLNARPDFSHFNCHDSESYLALARSMAQGSGYTRSMIPGAYVGHTTWPPGVPLLMVPAVALSGDKINWVLVKGTMALVGLTGVAFAWLLARRLTDSRLAADLAALAVAFNPFYWDFSHQAMTELPLTVWVFGSLLLIDVCWARRSPGFGRAFLVGVVAGGACSSRATLSAWR